MQNVPLVSVTGGLQHLQEVPSGGYPLPHHIHACLWFWLHHLWEWMLLVYWELVSTSWGQGGGRSLGQWPPLKTSLLSMSLLNSAWAVLIPTQKQLVCIENWPPLSQTKVGPPLFAQPFITEPSTPVSQLKSNNSMSFQIAAPESRGTVEAIRSHQKYERDNLRWSPSSAFDYFKLWSSI